jgi:hypothetical protein
MEVYVLMKDSAFGPEIIDIYVNEKDALDMVEEGYYIEKHEVFL